MIGQPLAALDSPQLLLDLDILDANLARMQQGCRKHGVNLRVHFKSLKCGGLAKYLVGNGVSSFLAAKLNEAGVLVDGGISDILIANEIIGPIKLRRLAELARRAPVMVCVDDIANVAALGDAMKAAGAKLGVLVEVNIGMNRCGVEPGEPVVRLARGIAEHPDLRFAGLQGYDGHLQMLPDAAERRRKCLYGLASLLMTRERLKEAGFDVPIITGGGTGTWEWVASFPGMTEVQPGSFLLMDAAYNAIRPEVACSLSILATVISHKPDRYVLDAGSKAISKDFGMPLVKGHESEKVLKLAEEHTIVETHNPPAIGERREVLPAHCCATMNLHRTCIAVRNGVVEGVWPIECSGRYD
ncbi:MAG TPA: DSD1 family PLP-dependent enzyme [Gemmataceae bacterium]|nr:DSD1 family PLP-dependent enzyme [Gemmataceae bacterium]